MQDNLSQTDLFQSTRGRVYLLWAILVGLGFVATHFYQNSNINGVWAVLSFIGLGYMYRVKPLGVSKMKQIYLSWLVPIILGIVVSGVIVHTALLPGFIAYLGPFWLGVMAVGYIWNGAVDVPAGWYYAAAVLNIAAAIVLCVWTSLLEVQYLIAAIISVWSMLNLWVFRSQ